jgi:hypothetical protein
MYLLTINVKWYFTVRLSVYLCLHENELALASYVLPPPTNNVRNGIYKCGCCSERVGNLFSRS